MAIIPNSWLLVWNLLFFPSHGATWMLFFDNRNLFKLIIAVLAFVDRTDRIWMSQQWSIPTLVTYLVQYFLIHKCWHRHMHTRTIMFLERINDMFRLVCVWVVMRREFGLLQRVRHIRMWLLETSFLLWRHREISQEC